jgi:cysteine desulfurase
MIYFDNNATTFMSPATIKVLVHWLNHGNPSSSYKAAVQSREMFAAFRSHLDGMIRARPGTWTHIFTSSSSEANSLIIRSTVDSFCLHRAPMRPHVIASAYEHKSILMTLDYLKKYRDIEVTLVPPGPEGTIRAEDIAAVIGPRTCLVLVMSANNETGAINDLAVIGESCHSRGVPFVTDVSQSFGKYGGLSCIGNGRGIDAGEGGPVDAFTLSFHKIHGPAGVGLLSLRTSFIEKYDLSGQIGGTQNGGLRGGTENTSCIAAAFNGLVETMAGRVKKNARQQALKIYCMKLLARSGIPCYTLAGYRTTRRPPTALEIVFISGNDARQWLSGTLLLSVVKHSTTGPDMCNTEVKERLALAGIIVSIGSACNTSSKYASHVLTAIGADDKIKKGALRLSFGDDTTKNNVEVFAVEFIKIISAYNK